VGPSIPVLGGRCSQRWGLMGIMRSWGTTLEETSVCTWCESALAGIGLLQSETLNTLGPFYT
jgi:hypothetical protein